MGVRRSLLSVLVLAVVAAPGLSCDDGASEVHEEDIDSQLMHAKNSQVAVLYAVPVGRWTVAITHDRTLHDSITDWGACMEQFKRCYVKTTGPVIGCVKSIKRCPADAAIGTARDCCPKQCIDDFATHVEALGESEEAATEATVIKGDCAKVSQ